MRTILAVLAVGLLVAPAMANIYQEDFTSGTGGWATPAQGGGNGAQQSLPAFTANPSPGDAAGKAFGYVHHGWDTTSLSTWFWFDARTAGWEGKTVNLQMDLFFESSTGDGSTGRNASMKVTWNWMCQGQTTVFEQSHANWTTNDVSNADWIHLDVPVTIASSGNNSILIEAGAYYSEWRWLMIDNVVLTPEPAGLALLGLGALFMRRRHA